MNGGGREGRLRWYAGLKSRRALCLLKIVVNDAVLSLPWRRPLSSLAGRLLLVRRQVDGAMKGGGIVVCVHM